MFQVPFIIFASEYAKKKTIYTLVNKLTLFASYFMSTRYPLPLRHVASAPLYDNEIVLLRSSPLHVDIFLRERYLHHLRVIVSPSNILTCAKMSVFHIKIY